MRKIKFRGVTSEGKVITSCGVRFDDDSPRLLVKDGFPAWQKILADSFTQLVGYDADGKEVYEGDIIETPDGAKFLIGDLNVGRLDFIASCFLKEQ